jgi:hypothetical protein
LSSSATDNLAELRARIEREAVRQDVPLSHALRRFEAFDRACLEAAAITGLPVDDDVNRAYASLRLQADSNIEAMLVGRPIDTGDHLRLLEALKVALPKPTKKHEVTITFCEEPPSKCPACGHVHVRDGDPDADEAPSPADGTPAPAPAPAPAPIDAEVSASSSDTNAAPDPVPIEPTTKPSPPAAPTKWKTIGDRTFMPSQDFVSGIEGWIKKSPFARSPCNQKIG